MLEGWTTSSRCPTHGGLALARFTHDGQQAPDTRGGMRSDPDGLWRRPSRARRQGARSAVSIIHNRAQVLLGICGVLLSTSVVLVTAKSSRVRFATTRSRPLAADGQGRRGRRGGIRRRGVLNVRWMTELPGDDLRAWMMSSLELSRPQDEGVSRELRAPSHRDGAVSDRGRDRVDPSVTSADRARRLRVGEGGFCVASRRGAASPRRSGRSCGPPHRLGSDRRSRIRDRARDGIHRAAAARSGRSRSALDRDAGAAVPRPGLPEHLPGRPRSAIPLRFRQAGRSGALRSLRGAGDATSVTGGCRRRSSRSPHSWSVSATVRVMPSAGFGRQAA